MILLLFAAAAADEPPAPAWDLSAEAVAVSDYRFRGVSLSERDPALQGSLDLEHESGFHAGVWASTLPETAGGAHAEVDLSAGYAAELAGGVELDGTLIYYAYPGDRDLDYLEAIATASTTLGPVTPSLGLAYAPAQNALRNESGNKDDNLYLFGGLELPLAKTPFTFNAGAGYERGPFDYTAGGGKWDWRLGASASLSAFTLGLAYTGSDANVPDERGRNLAGDTAVLSLGMSF